MIRKTLRLALGLTLVGSLANGCVIEDDDYFYVDERSDGDTEILPPQGQASFVTSIDTDFTLSTDLGEQAGVWVEYQAGGLWAIWTSCDTALSGFSCAWTIDVTAYGPIEATSLELAEEDDFVESLGDQRIRFNAWTNLGRDIVYVQTAPGELLQLRAFLDGTRLADEVPDFVVWTQGGQAVLGAPASPVTFRPSSP